MHPNVRHGPLQTQDKAAKVETIKEMKKSQH